MKIIIIGTAYPYRGGIAAFNERLAQQFIKEGHEVEIYTFTLQYPSFLFPGRTQYSNDPASEGLKIFQKINSINPLNWLKIGREIRRKAPELVIIPYWMSFMAPCLGTIASLIRKNKKTKIVGLVHNMVPHEPSLLDKIFPGCYVKNTDAFVSLSESVLKDIDKFDKKNKPKAFSPHPIYDHYGTLLPKNEAKQILNLDAQMHYVLFFGFIRAYKGLDLLLKAFSDERVKKLPLKLLIAGEFYEDEKTYLEIINDNSLEDKILLFNDFIPDSKVNLYFSACDLVAQPYKTATQSGVTQIAYHFEKPMLVTDVGGLAEIVPHGKVGYVVNPDEKEIADALVDFYDQNNESSFIENCKIEKEKYDWEKMTDTILNLYRLL
ncbi:MAG: glycosyltransferase [Bacteroidetes bacterium]|nr:glycosyltransferase [Bacteroidota bacterium]MCL2301887.1 glycosyltransferase [Lentimicrobiaceae bacterium]